MPTQAETTIHELPDLRPLLDRADGFVEVAAALQRGDSAAIDGAWGSSCALTVAALGPHAPGVILVVLPRIADVHDFAADLENFCNQPPLIFPAWETPPAEHAMSDAVFGGRLRVLGTLDSLQASPSASVQAPQFIVTCFPALLQPVPSRDRRRRASQRLRVGDELDIDAFLASLVARGFQRVPAIALPGEFSLHGGILDIFTPEALDPLRIELFGDEIESIRRFDVETQRKLDDLDSVEMLLLAPLGRPADEQRPGKKGKRKAEENGRGAEEDESLLESLPGESWIVLSELQDLVEEGKLYLSRLNDPRGLFNVNAAMSRCTQFPTVTVAAIAADSMETSCHLQIESIERFSGPKSQAIEELGATLGRDDRVLIACHNEGEQARLSELLAETAADFASRVHLCVGRIERGFRLVRDQLVVLSDHELFNRTDVRRAAPRRRLESRAIDSFLELNEGDLVVHLAHGIGRYRGMKLLEKDDQREEHLVLEFRDGVMVYVPVSLIHLVQKYVGSAGSVPNLSKLGTTSWDKKKQKASEAVTDMASDMLRLQAARDAEPGIVYPPDSHWQFEFEAAFPYTETDDQLRAIAEAKADMQRHRPMDRLICGDVGYGKTEVAMRAAFKAIDAGRQVAILVPTTVLAEQHYRTFSQRMAEFPISIEVLSRFKTKGQQRDILEAMAAGTVDLVVGTHRLVQKDVRFKDLGLLVIDEEQRFGVDAKEMLKRLRLEVDVLTLSATPIPRTLHMSLLGIRDISNLETPPHDRLSIETRICRFDPELIRSAIVRELNRGGQVYFVHNRVWNIQSIADRIQQIVPEATIDIAHGQMSEHDLEAAMIGFVSGRTDVLVCTTIIESGLDIPNANTIFIHQADNYGLADMHQLRGRVGRYRHRAYCYLLLEEGRSVTTAAAKRLKAIEEFSELGAGFKIAMRDLEIRGAGNILGTEQSGHIASVGYELYCQLLENAVRRLRNEPIREQVHVGVDLPISAFLPNSYVPAGRHKIEVYRRLSNVQTNDELQAFSEELRDRFGPIPTEAGRLLELKQLQLYAHAWKIDDVHLEENYAVFGYRNPLLVNQLRQHCGSDLRIVDSRRAYLLLPTAARTGDALLEHLKSMLQPH